MTSTITLDSATIQHLIEQSMNDQITNLVKTLGNDPAWLAKIELMLNQAVVQKTVATIGTIDVNSIIHNRVDENMQNVRQNLLTKFSSTGIDDRATGCQFTVMDENTVVENQLIAQSIESNSFVRTGDLIVTGSINTDNKSWNDLADNISNKTLNRLSQEWKDTLIQQVAKQIQENGIDFNTVTIGGEPLVSGDRLSSTIKHTSIESLGVLHELKVQGNAEINNTVSIVRGRLGINTQEPENTFSLWDEEVSVTMGKFKSQQAWIGTGRNQGLTIGINRIPQIELDPDGLTKIKKLQIGLHRIMHDSQAPGWSGAKGDIVFNSNFGQDRIFAWICLGTFKWQPLKSAE
jgi:hypothetical protein